MEDKEILIRQSVLMERMSIQVNGIEQDFKDLKDGHILKLVSDQAVITEKVSRMEKIIYGLGTLLAASIISQVVWAINH